MTGIQRPHPPIGFAHRGAARSSHDDNTLPAFQRALSLGARGLETDVALTSDGVPVLVHQGLSIRRDARISQLRRAELPSSVPSVRDLYETCGSEFDLALDMFAPDAAEAVVALAREYRADHRLWLTYWRIGVLSGWKQRWPEVRLVYPTLPIRRGGIERVARTLADEGIDALNLHHVACRRRVREITRDRRLLLFAWGVRSGRPLPRLLALPVDGVFCDDVPALAAALSRPVLPYGESD